VDCVRRLFLFDLSQTKKKLHVQKITTIIVESQEQLIHIRRLFGASFGARARCAPKLSDGLLPVKYHSATNAVWPLSSESIAKIKMLKKRKKNNINNVFCCSSICCLPSTNDEILNCAHECDMIQMKFDHATSIIAFNVVFTRLIVGEDNLVIDILKSIGHKQSVESLAVVNCEVGVDFMRDGQWWMIEDITNFMVTTTNCDNEIIRVHKSCMTCL